MRRWYRCAPCIRVPAPRSWKVKSPSRWRIRWRASRGIRTIKSVSREEVSQITIEFLLERDVDAAANDVRDRVARVRGQLPDETDDPVVAKIEADAQAIMWLAFSSDRHSALEITDYADRTIVDRLQALPGVASVIIAGERRYAMRLWLDRDRMAAYGLTRRMWKTP